MAPHSLDRIQAPVEMSPLEAIDALSEIELLGLDKPRLEHEVSTKHEGEYLPRAAFVLQSLARNEEALSRFLSRYGISSGEYDAENNPTGLFEPGSGLTEADKQRRMLVFGARLCGVPTDILRSFFSSENTLQGVSTAAREKIGEIDVQRERYPISHIQQFPAAYKAYQRARAHGAPELESIFDKEATIPAIGDWIVRQGYQSDLLFELTLTVLADALSGGKSINDIARERRMEASKVRNLLRPAKSGRKVYSQEVLGLIKTRLKKNEEY